ncbi:MAG: Long-chain-fatty-acid--CoA ligase [Verrucomicrobia subdivision 3 bacterium]|nr:Long-chain-fatty-acid--CoA ligase [Limisphaerales bacterium]MCS1415823.1 Long-chain-fatty-acid--CoA ligase [Limisphaerales bacterium]
MVPDIVRQGAERFGDKVAVSDPDTELSYVQLATAAARFANLLCEIGVEVGDRVLVVLPNSVRFTQAHFGILSAGAISVPCDSAITRKSLTGIYRNCEPRVLVTDALSLKRLCLDSEPLGLEGILVFGAMDSDDKNTNCRSVEDALADDSRDVGADMQVQDDAVASLMYTTGTTGGAKGVPLTHRNIHATLTNITRFIGYTEQDREVIILPLSHNFGLGHLYCNLISGGGVYTENGMARVGRVLKKLSEFGATGFPGTPTGFGILIDKYGEVLRQRGQHLRFSVINSAPLPPERTAQLQALLPNLDIMVYYGLTEVSRSTFISLTSKGPNYYASVGRSMDGVKIEVLDSNGQGQSPGESGEVAISGPTVTSGYWRNEELNRAVFKNGRLYTGDLGYKDEQGHLFLTGRKKDFINVGGYKVNPAEVEKVIEAYPGVGDVGVVGIEGVGGVTGESVVAGVVVEVEPFDFGALETHCLRQLEKFKVPAVFERVDAIPRANTGKAKRVELAKLIRSRWVGEDT